ncbi:hypothetical protein IX335_001607 [Porphyromonas levii]|uniref:hypothetical protein n=1 Tax=Porphyromonas levii TaxID=28114 RepID=UPI001BACF37B|nr:hypothetical protein [Porphyromonas levii]MBR8764377.1 hypothetical protein [Porphyromonas levii]
MLHEITTVADSCSCVAVLLLLLGIALPSCGAGRQSVRETQATTHTVAQDSSVQATQIHRHLAVEWWGEPPQVERCLQDTQKLPKHVPIDPLPLRRGGYSIDLVSEERSQSVGRDTLEQTSSTSYLAREKSGPNRKMFYLGLALGLSLFALYILMRVRSKTKRMFN